MSRKGLILTVFIVVMIMLSGPLEAQCAMCKQAAASSMDNDPRSMARNLNTGILYLMAVPYLMIAFIFRKQIAAVWRRWRGKPLDPAQSGDEII
ncbi:MAG: hypothetical protein ACXVPQ_03325 [Bacteroidia bacterium]